MRQALAERPGVVVRVGNAFRPEQDREIFPVRDLQTVSGWLETQGIEQFPSPTVCILNGQPLMRAAWNVSQIKGGDVCVFIALPHGGGGGGGGKNPLRTVLMLAVMVAAAYFAGPLGNVIAEGMFGAGHIASGLTATQLAIGKAIAGGLITAVGTTIVNTLVPPPKPTAASFSGSSFGAPPAPSPTYNIQGQGNSARLGQAIPCQYGRHRVFPDLIAEPWTQYTDNEQFLYQAHCLGLGEYDVERINIVDTDIANFEEITYEIVEPGQAPTLFDTNVVTRPEVSGQELKGTNEQDGDGFVGPFVLNPVDTVARKAGFDWIFARGLYFANTSGGLDSKTINWVVEIREIDDDDLPVGDGSWTVLATETHTASDNTPIRISTEYTLPAGDRFEVQVRRTDERDTSSRAGHELRWGGVKAVVDGPSAFDGVTLLLVKMRATDNLSQRTSRAINVIQTRKLPIWDDETQTWSAPTATSDVSAAFSDIARADYGGGMADSQINMAEMTALAATLQARGDTFDGVFDSKTTVWDALTKVARCGRAVPILQGGTLRAVRDTPQTLPVAMFGPRNIVKGSFKISYIMPSDDTADAVKVEFFSSRSWKPDDVTSKVSDSAGEKPATVPIMGIVRAAHAEQEAEYMAADNRYRRQLVTFRTELEGMIPTYGDLISVSHDVPRWGQAGEVVEWDAASSMLLVSEKLIWVQGQTHYLGLRARDGSLVGLYQCEAGVDARQVHLLEQIPITPYTGSHEERTHFSFGPGEGWAKLCRVLSVRPRNGGEQVEITSVGEDSRVHVN